MADRLVRAVPEEDDLLIAAKAARAGVSQTEYLRRLIHEDVARTSIPLASVAGSATGLFPDGVLDVLDAEWDE
ncbi:antitoxin [Flexivirga caeni]|uniref:Antitoxin n=1 Tax=Flexivirga caeni TaxID=2294115 RepID=A0A3M9M6I7_9MICO|nr:antitoxin [Flexivirga caeni]RNI21170.1 antitoxin [Flexivirga caeni]